MAEIREQLSLEDRFTSTLDRYIDKLSKAAAKSQENHSAMSRLTNGALKMATGLRSSIQDAQAFYQTESRMSGATGALVDQLSGLESAIHNAFTDQEADAYLKKLQSEMQKAGLVWTNAADQMEASDMIVRVGLRQLAQEGKLAASSIAESSYSADKAAGAQERHGNALDKARSALGRFLQKLSGVNRAEKAYDSLGKQFNRFALTLFSVSRIVDFLKSSLERAPESIQNSWNSLGDSLSNLFGGAIVASLQKLQGHIDKLTKALNSDAGQKLSRGLETLAGVGGSALGVLLDVLSQVVTFIGDNFQSVMTVAAVVAGVFAAQMLLAAVSTLAAAAPILLIVGLVSSFVVGLMAAGVTSEQIFSAIGAAAGWLYALVYNLVADAWNIFATFAEFFANVFNDPVAAVAHLFFDTFDNILGVVETVAGAIDAVLKTDMAGAVAGFRSSMSQWVNDTFGENQIKIDRMEKIEYQPTMDKFSSIGSSLANSLSDFSLSNAAAAPLGSKMSDTSDNLSSIADSVGSIEKSVDMSQEDLKSLVDVAERRYVNNINLTSQAPVIQITGQNTGNTAADRKNLADTIRDILVEQVASGSTINTATVPF